MPDARLQGVSHCSSTQSACPTLGPSRRSVPTHSPTDPIRSWPKDAHPPNHLEEGLHVPAPREGCPPRDQGQEQGGEGGQEAAVGKGVPIAGGQAQHAKAGRSVLGMLSELSVQRRGRHGGRPQPAVQCVPVSVPRPAAGVGCRGLNFRTPAERRRCPQNHPRSKIACVLCRPRSIANAPKDTPLPPRNK